MLSVAALLNVMTFLGIFVCQSTGEELPSINYWEITLDLVRSVEMQAAISISPEQRKQLLAFRSRKDLGDLLQQKAVEFQESGVTDVTHAPFHKMDGVVRNELSKILRVEQLNLFKLVKMRSKFATGYSPFMDQEILGVLKLSRMESEKMIAVLERATASYLGDLEKSLFLRTMEIVDALPVESQDLLGVYAGKLVPLIGVTSDVDFHSIPYPSFVKSISTVSMVGTEQFQREAGLSQEQIKQLNLLNSECSLDNFSKQNKHKTISEYWQHMNGYAYTEVKKILNKEQLFLAARIQAGGEFRMNPVVPLSRPEFLAFLRIPEAQIESIRAVAKEETVRHQSTIKELNRDTFDQIANTLPETARLKTFKLFENVWK